MTAQPLPKQQSGAHESRKPKRNLRLVKPTFGPDDPEYYPTSDGEPMAENTLHYRWITALFDAVCFIFSSDPMVFIASDLLWYPEYGNNTVCRAPDVYAAFGRPKRRGSKVGAYLQWLEEGISPQVVIEVRSDSDTKAVLQRKFSFYQANGVEEYYLCHPETAKTEAWIRKNNLLVPVEEMKGWVSPRLGLRFEAGGEFNIAYPDGTPIKVSLERVEEEIERRNQETAAREKAEAAKEKAEAAQKLEQKQREKAEAAQKLEREQREKAEAAQKLEREQREKAEARADALMALLRQAGLDPDTALS